jgi:hypothetical protein
MALSDFAVFSEWTYATIGEIVDQQIDLFNAASNGCIVLRPMAHSGDYNEAAFFKYLSGLVRRRDAYGSGSVTAIKLEHLIETSVKVAAGTAPVEYEPQQFLYIQKNPEDAGIEYGRQLAPQMMQDMLNTAILATNAALSGVAAVNIDVSGDTKNFFCPQNANKAARLFGDRSNAIGAWITHSSPMHDFYGDNLSNAERLFTYDTVNVVRDPFGRVFVVSDTPSLVNGSEYDVLGLVPGAAIIETNNDFYTDEVATLGNENISRTMQSEWTFNTSVRGFTWDKTNGGKSPNNGALGTATNWDKIATSIKDLAGVRMTVADAS